MANGISGNDVGRSAGARLVFAVEQHGGMPGRLTASSGVALLPDGGGVVVAETEQRLQVCSKN